MDGKKILVVLAEGFEEVEALAPIDVLRRAGGLVTIAGLGGLSVRGAHDVEVCCDARLDNVCSQRFDAIVLPGGMPGAENLRKSELVKDLILDAKSRGDLICAICASPAYVLAPTGVLEGRRATCYPGCEKVAPTVRFTDERVVQDGNIITAAGPAVALEFGLMIARTLFGEAVSERIGHGMLAR